MGPAEEKRLQEIVRPILLQGRNGDWEHTLRALEGLNSWFKTPTAKSLAHQLAVEMGLFD